MDSQDVLLGEDIPEPAEAAVNRAFGAANRNRLINRYFASHDTKISPSDAWKHVYRLLLWSDPTTGLAHCYESDKSQPGKLWYGRSLAFHDWLSTALNIDPSELAQSIDWLFVTACRDLAAATALAEQKLAAKAETQRALYHGRGFPEPGTDPELALLIAEALGKHLSGEPTEHHWRMVTQRVRQYLAVQNKRKNLVGEGFEDVLAQVVERVCGIGPDAVMTRKLLYDLPGFNRARHGGKENKVDLAVLEPDMRTIVTAKWSVRADREKQFPAEYEEYCNAESIGKKFKYVFVTNEFDPARLMRACEALYRNNPMFDHVVHISTDAVRAAYADRTDAQVANKNSSWSRVEKHIQDGRLISLGDWLSQLCSPPL